MNTKRTTGEIIQQILTKAKETIYQEKLRKNVNISPQMFEDYVEKMVKKGLIEVEYEKKRINYTTTSKGKITREKLMKANNTIRQITGFITKEKREE